MSKSSSRYRDVEGVQDIIRRSTPSTIEKAVIVSVTATAMTVRIAGSQTTAMVSNPPDSHYRAGDSVIVARVAGRTQGIQWTIISNPPRRETAYSFVPLQTPLTSSNFLGTASSDVSATEIDLNSEFGVPVGVKAVLVEVTARDSGSASATSCELSVGPSSYSCYCVSARPTAPNDSWHSNTGPCPCNNAGNIFYYVNATGTLTLDMVIRIWGYWI